MTQRNEGYPAKICISCLAPKNHQVSFHGHFFFSPTGPVSSHHPITTTRPLGESQSPARPPSRCEISLRKVLVKTESMPPTCLKQVLRCESHEGVTKNGERMKHTRQLNKKIMSQNRNAQHLRKIQNVKVKLAKILWCFKPNCWTNTHSWTSPSSIGIALVHRP